MTTQPRTTDVAIRIGDSEPVTIQVGLPAETLQQVATAVQAAIGAHYASAYAQGAEELSTEILDVLGQDAADALAIQLTANRMVAHATGGCGRFRCCPLCAAEATPKPILPEAAVDDRRRPTSTQ